MMQCLTIPSSRHPVKVPKSMVTITTPQPSPIDPSIQYGPVFARYLAGALRQSLAQVQEHRYTVPEDVRVQAWQVLQLTLTVDELWAQTSQLLIELAPRMNTGGIWSEWIPYLRQGIASSVRLEDAEAKAHLSLALGTLLRRQSAYAEAETLLLESRAIYQRCKMPDNEALVLNELALQCWSLNEFPVATELAQEALRLFNFEHPERANSYYILGNTKQACGKLDDARPFFEKALQIRRRQGNQPKVANNLVALAVLEQKQGNYDSAKTLLTEAVELLTKSGDVVQPAYAHNILGIIFSLSGDSARAVELYRRAEAGFQKVGLVEGLGDVYTNLGLDHGLLGDWVLGEHYLKASIAICQQVNHTESAVNAMIELANLYQKQALWTQAEEWLQSASQLLETIPQDPRYEKRKNEIVTKMQLNKKAQGS